MLVCPGTCEIDQAGNAARVVWHRLGLKAKMASVSTISLRRKIHTILSNRRYYSGSDQASMENPCLSTNLISLIDAVKSQRLPIPSMIKTNNKMDTYIALTDNELAAIHGGDGEMTTVIGATLGGALVGAVVGAMIGGPYGALALGTVGAVVGFFAGANYVATH